MYVLAHFHKHFLCCRHTNPVFEIKALHNYVFPEFSVKALKLWKFHLVDPKHSMQIIRAHRREHLIYLTAGLFGHHEDWKCIFSSCIIIYGNAWAIELIAVGLLE